MCTDYLRKWVETKVVKATEEKVVEFLRENIFYKFWYPREKVNNQGAQFTSHLIEKIERQHSIKHRRSTTYHPQANGKVDVTNSVEIFYKSAILIQCRIFLQIN